MRVSFRRDLDRTKPAVSSPSFPLDIKAALHGHWPPRRKGVFLRRTGRIVDLRCSLSASGEGEVFVQLSEREIFLLAAVCRRDRTDVELLQAILKAEAGEPEGRKNRSSSRRSAENVQHLSVRVLPMHESSQGQCDD